MAGIQGSAIVIGNGWVKAARYVSGKLKLDGFPSVLAEQAESFDFEGLNAGQDFVLEMDGHRTAIGLTAFKLSRLPQTMMDRGRVDTSFYKTLFAAALSTAHPKSAQVSVILSLPLSWYENRQAVKDNLGGHYSFCVNGEAREYDVMSLRIVPEGFGTLCGMVLTAEGEINEKARALTERSVGIVEIGTLTTDMPEFDSLELIPSRSRTVRAGLVDVWSLVQREIANSYGMDYELHQIDAIVQEGGFHMGSDWIDIKPISARGFTYLADKLRAEIVQSWAAGKGVYKIILSGGGAMEQYGMLEKLGFSNAEVAKAANQAPYAADVIGALYYKRLKDAQENSAQA